jgi:hypothetical protein
MRTDGETAVTKLIVAFRNVANAPKNARIDMWVLNGGELIETVGSGFTFYLLLIV